MRMNELRALTKQYADFDTVQGEAYRLHQIAVKKIIFTYYL